MPDYSNLDKKRLPRGTILRDKNVLEDQIQIFITKEDASPGCPSVYAIRVSSAHWGEHFDTTWPIMANSESYEVIWAPENAPTLENSHWMTEEQFKSARSEANRIQLAEETGEVHE